MPGNPLMWAPGGSSWYGQLRGDPQFQALSPASQATLIKYAPIGNGNPKAFQAALQSDPALQSALAEAKANGSLDHPITPFMKGLMLAIGGVATAGVLSAAFAPAAASTFVGPTAAQAGLAGAPAAGAAAGGVGAAAAGPSIGSTLARYGIGPGVQAATSLIGTHMANSASDRAAELQAKSTADALAFAKEQEAQRHAEWQATQDRNYGLWQAREAQLQPFRNFGTGAIAQLGQPIPGSIGALVGR